MTDPIVSVDPKKPAAGVLAALRKLVLPATPAEVAAATGLSEAMVQRTLGRLGAVKDARKAGGGRFTASRHAPN